MRTRSFSLGGPLRVDTSVFDQLRDDQLKQQDDIDKEWETLMVSGPIVVGYMGNLMVLASKKDFPFQAPTNYVYRYIRSFQYTFCSMNRRISSLLADIRTHFVPHWLKSRRICTMLWWVRIHRWIKYNWRLSKCRHMSKQQWNWSHRLPMQCWNPCYLAR